MSLLFFIINYVRYAAAQEALFLGMIRSEIVFRRSAEVVGAVGR